MVKILIAIKNCLDGFDLLGDKGLAGRLVQCVVAVFALVLFCVILPSVFGFAMLNFPRFFTFLMLTSIIISIIMLCISLALYLISDLIGNITPKSVGNEALAAAFLFSILFSIVFFCLWWFESTSLLSESTRSRFFPPKVQFPLGNLNGIAVDKKGDIYLGVRGYSRIQRYNSEGVFLKGWFINTGSGLFDIWIDDKNNLNVRVVKPSDHLIFNADGQLLKTTKITSPEEDEYLAQKASGLRTKDAFGNTYAIENPKWSPKVVKINSVGKKSILIKDPVHFYLFRYPQPLFSIGIIGFIMSAVIGFIIKFKISFP